MSGRSPLESLFVELVDKLANASLRLDPRSKSRLLAIEGRCVHLVAELPAPIGRKTVGVSVIGGHLQLAPDPADVPNAIASGTMADFLSWLTSGGANTGRMTFEGDEAVLQEIADIFRGYTPDFGIPLAALVGEDVANGLIGVADGALATLKSVAEGAGSAIRRGAAEHYATRDDLATFLQSLDDARSRVDRLSARVAEAQRQPQERRDPGGGSAATPEAGS